MSIPRLEAHWELDAVSRELEVEMSFLIFQEIPDFSLVNSNFRIIPSWTS